MGEYVSCCGLTFVVMIFEVLMPLAAALGVHSSISHLGTVHPGQRGEGGREGGHV